MDSRSFSLTLTNLFIGLVRGNRLLIPYSNIIKKLKYSLVALETTFSTPSNAQVTPELLAASASRMHAIQTEWTSASSEDAINKKEVQINKLMEIDGSSISDFLPVLDFNNVLVSTLLVVSRSLGSKYLHFTDLFSDEGLIVCEFDFHMLEEVYRLDYIAGRLHDEEFSKVIEGGMIVNRIPYEYTYHEISDVQSKGRILKIAIDQLVAFSFQGRKRFTIDEFCSEIYGDSEAWNALEDRKRSQIKRNADSALRLFKKEKAEKYLEKTETIENGISWNIKSAPSKTAKMAEKFILEKMEDGYIVDSTINLSQD